MNQAEQNYLKSIELLGAQIGQSYQEAGRIHLPSDYRKVNKIVTCGMGGSQLGVDLISNLFSQELKVPIIQIKDYQLPKFVDAKTLIFLLSYSGNTEEVTAVSKKQKAPARGWSAFGRKSKVIIITVGGKLAKMAKKNHWPMYQFEPKNNPSGQPRMGTGYVIGSLAAILKKLKLLNLSKEQIQDLIKVPSSKSQVTKKFQAPNPNFQTLMPKARSLALKLKNKIPIIVTAEHLNGNAHIMANQINESSKQRCYFFAIPELNHHLLEGLTYPKMGLKNLYFLLFFSKNYHLRNQKRFQITKEVLAKQKIKYQQLNLPGPLRRSVSLPRGKAGEASNKINQALSMLTLGSLLSYELAKINKVDPNKIPWVNYFKKRLGK